jgi:mono/diheme cytochrome c family protein
MSMNLAGLLIGSTMLLGIGASQDVPKIKQVPLSKTSPVAGQQMFLNYCAACHGKDGRGGGPAAAALKTSPADLTQLAIRNNGTFPEERVAQSINGPERIAAHGSREMPIWGELFKSLDSDRAAARLRVTNLTNYIKSIQRK